MRHKPKRSMTKNHSHFQLPTSHLEPVEGRARHGGRRAAYAFTLVELLVVIAIIALLAGLIIGAAGPAVTAARQAVITAEINQYNQAIEDFKNSVQAYPPNAQTDGLAPTASQHLDNDRVLANFKRFFNKAFPSHRESPELLEALVGLSGTAQGATPASGEATNLPGGMNAAEAMVFWLGGFSDDPKYPISGTGGPSYSLGNLTGGVLAHQADPIDNRSWRLGISIENLGPRDDANYFPANYQRFITYTDPRNGTTVRRINFWYLKAPNNITPYVYFDTSRGSGVDAEIDAPAATGGVAYTGPEADALAQLQYVHAVKQLQEDASARLPFRYANAGKFQIMHAGVDEEWGIFPMVNPNPPSTIDRTDTPLFTSWLIDPRTQTSPQPWYLHFPVGPWTLELADTQTNFADVLEDSQP